MKKITIKEIRMWMKTLEENRYRKIVNADARRIAWFVNNSMSENYDDMPESMRKKWVKAEYKKERYMAKKFLESKKQNESVENKVRQIIREEIQNSKLTSILDKLSNDSVKKEMIKKYKNQSAFKTYLLAKNEKDQKKWWNALLISRSDSEVNRFLADINKLSKQYGG